MKKTKEIKEENPIEKILEFESQEDAEKFEELANGRKFCKRGERIQDICEDELENYTCRNNGNIILKLYLHRKLKKNKLKLECRFTRVIRAVTLNVLNEENEKNITEMELTKKVKETILKQVKKYEKQLEKSGE